MRDFMRDNEVENKETFYDWLIRYFNEANQTGEPSFPPSLNTMHHDPEAEIPDIETKDLEIVFLRNRMDFMQVQRTKFLEKIHNLEDTVEKLTEEVKDFKEHWSPKKGSLTKRQPKLKNQDKLEEDEYETPKKKKKPFVRPRSWTRSQKSQKKP